jgi:hypothetical protein
MLRLAEKNNVSTWLWQKVQPVLVLMARMLTQAQGVTYLLWDLPSASPTQLPTVGAGPGNSGWEKLGLSQPVPQKGLQSHHPCP